MFVCKVIKPVTVPVLVITMLWFGSAPTVNAIGGPSFKNVYSDCVPMLDTLIANIAPSNPLSIPWIKKSELEVHCHESVDQTGPTETIFENAGWVVEFSTTDTITIAKIITAIAEKPKSNNDLSIKCLFLFEMII